MLREDLSGRFDYLFEPLEADGSAGDGDAAALDEPKEPRDDGRWSRRIVLVGGVIATLAAATATVVVLLEPAGPAQDIVIPTDSTPLSTSAPASLAPATTTGAPVPLAPATSDAPAPQTSAARAAIVPQQPPNTPTTVASQPARTAPPTAATRAPISVSPESRPPFPNQSSAHRGDGGGGLLGGLL